MNELKKKNFSIGVLSLLLGIVYLATSEKFGQLRLSGGRVIEGWSYYLVVGTWLFIGVYFVLKAIKKDSTNKRE